MADHIKDARWAKLSKNGAEWQWGLYNEVAILLCVLSDAGFDDLVRSRGLIKMFKNQVDDYTYWLGPTHPNEQWLKKKKKSFEKMRRYQHVLKRGVRAVHIKPGQWLIYVEDNRWIGNIVTGTEYLGNLCHQLGVPFDSNEMVVQLR